ncbi:YcgL domain-containing protein [Frankliniella fusca]|uniref:YcgL domain-containing protein n=1 Tax=Frankliniella fusca TaxID=407009 RepID=A0AAE1HHV6_9NEOP|nr:YcgL domain-containing protein [Frankliniella fusca]
MINIATSSFVLLICFTSDLNQTTAKLHIVGYYLQLSSPVVIRRLRPWNNYHHRLETISQSSCFSSSTNFTHWQSFSSEV